MTEIRHLLLDVVRFTQCIYLLTYLLTRVELATRYKVKTFGGSGALSPSPSQN